MRRLNTKDAEFKSQFDALRAFESAQNRSVDDAVREICDDVRARGDAAVLEYTNKFDGTDAKSIKELEIGRGELQSALDNLKPETLSALKTAAARVRSFHERQLGESWSYEDEDGTRLGQNVFPLDKVGVYVPGGLAAYPSTVYMNAMPAAVAGVGETVMVSPAPKGQRNPLVLAAAALCGVSRVFAVGGAQAIAALAYGTESIPKVDKICGPGNAFVAAAKRRVFGAAGIDMVAGPSEILAIADGSTDPEWMAMDLFSQAEHDRIAQAILISPDPDFLDRVEKAMERFLPAMPRKEIIKDSLANRGALILCESIEQAAELANEVAPEHMEIAVADKSLARRLAQSIRHAGAVFIGPQTTESLGDYCAGPNHVLPTSGTARFASPLGVYDFQKRCSVIEVSEQGAQKLAPIASILARGEGLIAHANAAEFRIGPKIPG